MTMLTCTAENVAEFRAALRDQPEINAFAAALHKAGLIDGLRNVRLADVGELPETGVCPVLSMAAEKRIEAAGKLGA